METIDSEAESLRLMVSVREREIAVIRSETEKAKRVLTQMHASILGSNDELEETNRRIVELQQALGMSNADFRDLEHRLLASAADEESVASYIQSDSLKVKELRRKVDDLNSQISRKQEALFAMEEEEAISRLELEGQLQFLRELSKAKQGKCHILQSRLAQIHDADSGIEKLSAEYSAAISLSQQKTTKLASVRESVSEAKMEVLWYNREVASVTKAMAKLRDTIESTKLLVDEEHLFIKQANADEQLQKRQLRANQEKLDRAIKDVEVEKSKISILEQKIQSQVARSEAILSGKSAKETEAADARHLVDEVLGKLGECETTVSALKSQIIDDTTSISELKQKIATTNVEISGTSNGLSQINKRIQRIDDSEESMRDESSSLKLEIERVNFKLGSLVGHVNSNEERDRLVAQLRDLETQLREVRAVQTSLTNEGRHVEVEIKKTERETDSVRLDLVAVESHQQELEVEVDAIDREAKALDSEFAKQLLIRDELTAQMSSKRDDLEATINKYIETKTIESEKEKCDRQLKVEAAAEGEKLQQINRELHEQKHFLATKAGDLRTKISQLQTHLDHMVRQRTGADEDDIHSQAHAVVKAAQERQALAEEADHVAKLLEESKEELRVLEAALVSMQRGGRNEWKELETRKREFDKKIANLDSESAKKATLEFVTSNIESLKRIVRENYLSV
jgi:chromosome segregation ATPase